MNIFTCKKTLAAVMLSCLCSMANAQKSLTVTTEAGKLSEKVVEADRYNVTELKISGSINGTDILLLRKMAGGGQEANATTEGKLSSLDLSEANIVAGGDNYFAIKRGMSSMYYKPTENDVVAPYMFSGLTKLTKLQLPTGTKSIEKYALSGCTALAECAIPQQTTAVKEYAFNQCSKLSSLTIPATVAESVTEIGTSAFADCSSLASVTFPAQLTKIGKQAFENCTSLGTLSEFPATLESIEEKAFFNAAVKAFKVAEGNEDYTAKNGVLYSGDETSLELYPIGSTTASFEFPEGVAAIEDYAFAYAKNLKSIKIPEGLTNIGESAFAFSGLTQLTSVASGLSIGRGFGFPKCEETLRRLFCRNWCTRIEKTYLYPQSRETQNLCSD